MQLSEDKNPDVEIKLEEEQQKCIIYKMFYKRLIIDLDFR